jgi:hypothetical protein
LICQLPPLAGQTSGSIGVDKLGEVGEWDWTQAHESPRTTKLYNRTGDEITLGELEAAAGGAWPSWSSSAACPYFTKKHEAKRAFGDK